MRSKSVLQKRLGYVSASDLWYNSAELKILDFGFASSARIKLQMLAPRTAMPGSNLSILVEKEWLWCNLDTNTSYFALNVHYPAVLLHSLILNLAYPRFYSLIHAPFFSESARAAMSKIVALKNVFADARTSWTVDMLQHGFSTLVSAIYMGRWEHSSRS